MEPAARPPADLLITGATHLNVFSGELVPAAVAIRAGRIAGLGDCPARQTLDLSGLVLLPGLCEGHLHLESAMLSPGEFANAAVLHGTTTIVADPHEICNVQGVAGARFLLEATPRDRLDLYLMAPSCVPATPLETAGATLGVTEVRDMLTWPEVLGLGEVMNFPGVVAGVPEVLAKIAAAAGRPVDGHAPGLTGDALATYVAAGPDSDHECTSLAEAQEKLALGMWIMLREGSASRDLSALAPLLTGPGRHRCLLVSDDLCADDLLRHGHLDRLLRRAQALGVPLLEAVRAVTHNVAQRFGLRQRGAIAPGYVADLVAVEDTRGFNVHTVVKRGQVIVSGGQLLQPATVSLASSAVRPPAVTLGDDCFRIEALGGGDQITCRVIEALDGQIVTGASVATLAVANGQVGADVASDVLKLAVIERHRRAGGTGLGFVRGFGLKQGALASTVAHDSHNLIVVGCDDQSMLTAARTALASGGGQVAAVGTKVKAHLPLPLAGLMSDLPAASVARRTQKLRQTAQALGATLSHPFMTLSFLALPVIPELKLTDRGLVDVRRFTLVPLVAG